MPAPTPRTTPALVEGIIDVQAGTDLTPFIATANMLVTAICTYPNSTTPNPYTDGFAGSQMELIERWLSAHFYAIFDAQLTTAKAGTAGVGFQYKIDYGLKLTMWGQTAIMLDYLGGLAAWDNTAQIKRIIKVGIFWMGSRWCFNPLGFPDADLTVGQ